MATTDPISGINPSSAARGADLLVMVAEMPSTQQESVLAGLTASFPAEGLVIATPNELLAESYPALQIISIPATNAVWPLTAGDFTHACELAKKTDARAILILGPESGSISSTGMYELANAALTASTDLAVPYYDLPPHAGLANSAIFYPLSRALFANRARFPLAIDLGLSLRMAERLASAASRFISLNQADALLWPVNEAMVAGFSINEFDVGPRALPQPAEPDVNALLTLITGSLFTDIEAKATFWQRPRRLLPPRHPVSEILLTDGSTDIGPMIESFRLAYSNLQEIWALVLPPNSMLGLKRLSVIDPAAFHMPENLWARIIFDFLIAYRLRTINRGHLLGALIPLYLAWVAGHLNVIASGTSPERHIETVAAAFEAEKPYVVSRWRWPDRFNT